MDLETLRTQKGRIWNQMVDLMDGARLESRAFTAEEAEQYDRMEADLAQVEQAIERAERHAARQAQFEVVQRDVRVLPSGDRVVDREERRLVSTEEYRDAFHSYLRHGMARIAPEKRSLLEKTFSIDEVRAQAVGTDSAGGYLVADEFANRIIERRKAFGGMRRVANIIETATGATLYIPTNDDTGNVGAILGENQAAPEQDAAFGQKSLGAYVYTSKMVKVSRQLLQDSAFDIEDFLARKLGERLGRAENAHFTTGTGTSQPEGLVTGIAAGNKVTIAGSAVVYADVVELLHKVDPAYRDDAVFMFNDTTLKQLRLLLDGNNLPLWQPGLAQGQPNTILGHRYVINQDMANEAASTVFMVCGDLRGYWIRDVQGIQLIRLEERYAENLQVAFLAFMRVDGKLIDGNGVAGLVGA